MKRILVIGPGGSGKSTLSKRLAERTGLPVIHLDAAYWRSGWVEPSPEEWTERIEQLVAGERWIMDGNFGGTMKRRLAACYTVVFLDLPPWTCLWRVLQRRIKHHGRARPDMTIGCNERLGLDFLWWILTYRISKRPTVLERLSGLRSDQEVSILKSASDMERFLQSLPTMPTPTS